MTDLCNKKPADARRKLEPLVTGPVSIDAMTGLAMTAEADSDRAGAIRWYRKVLAADSKNFSAASGLSRLGAATQGGN
jgi:hypothetical protein